MLANSTRMIRANMVMYKAIPARLLMTSFNMFFRPNFFIKRRARRIRKSRKMRKKGMQANRSAQPMPRKKYADFDVAVAMRKVKSKRKKKVRKLSMIASTPSVSGSEGDKNKSAATNMLRIETSDNSRMKIS